MTETERDLLMPFLRKLVNTQSTPGDDAASNLIRNALRRQPNASYLLVQRALALECELASAQSRILQLEGKTPAQVKAPPVPDFLNLQTAHWGEKVQRSASPTTSKKLYDFFKQSRQPHKMDLESRVVSYVGAHSGRIWLVILVLAATVVAFQEKLV